MSRLMIIGNGPAGIKAAETIRMHDSKTPIKIITKDQLLPYSRISLAGMVSGNLARSDIISWGKDFFENFKIDVVPRAEAVSVNPSSKSVKVRTSNKEQDLKYSKLLIATGSSTFLPPIKGLKNKGVCTLESLHDAEKIVGLLKNKNTKKCIVVGAGFIGLESAEALRKLGCDVKLVELKEFILPELLNKSSAKIVEEKIEKAGIKIYLDTQIEKIVGNPVKSVVINGKQVECNLIVLSTGMRPNTDLVKNSEIEIDEGIIVDERMKASAEGVYAAGDVAQAYNIFGERKINQTWISAALQGMTAGSHMAGVNSKYDLGIRQNNIDVFDSKIVSIGQTPTEARSMGFQMIQSKKKDKAKIGIFDSDKLVGFISIGYEDVMREAGTIASLVRKKVEIDEKENIFLRGFFSRKFLPRFGRTSPMI